MTMSSKPPKPHGKRPRLLLGIAAALTLVTGAGLATAGASGQDQPRYPQEAQLRSGPEQFGMTELALLQLGPARQPSPSGDYQTFTSQTGAVESVRSGALTVDGRTYAIDESTRVVADYKGLQGIQQGDQVWVVGTTGGSPRAIIVADASRPALPGHGGGGAPPGQTPQTPQTPTAPGTPSEPGAPGESPSPETVPPTE
ncbi:hypothetical protein SAMN05421833_13656 [Microbispora rosea]|uniref:DUF5666 domain-containing protein n=1 Tax=Microbispora rosea TaxID=58117 RepID=A0A1N7H3T3_9ACTN|nr:hypothetical protein [Microbispora rosea]GIH44869.1 hypothetical protein Mro03_00480 [Microbispora rosea subsp. rosea]SIS19502.1 hypothetical protein SAMN05421833_13656 [Microbispora rosea]